MTNTIQNYWPEMQQTAPAAQCEIRPSAGSKIRVWTRETFPAMRGVKLVRVLTTADLVEQSAHRAGTNEYELTPAALEALKAKFTFNRECLLD